MCSSTRDKTEGGVGINKEENTKGWERRVTEGSKAATYRTKGTIEATKIRGGRKTTLGEQVEGN